MARCDPRGGVGQSQRRNFRSRRRAAYTPALIEGAITLSQRDLGIGERMRIGSALGNCIDHFILYFAPMRVGAVPAGGR